MGLARSERGEITASRNGCQGGGSVRSTGLSPARPGDEEQNPRLRRAVRWTSTNIWQIAMWTAGMGCVAAGALAKTSKDVGTPPGVVLFNVAAVSGGCLPTLDQLKLADGGNFAIAQIAKDVEHFRPSGKRSVIHPLVLINRLDEFKLFLVHVPFFGRAAIVGPTPTRAAASVESGSLVHPATVTDARLSGGRGRTRPSFDHLGHINGVDFEFHAVCIDRPNRRGHYAVPPESPQPNMTCRGPIISEASLLHWSRPRNAASW